MHWPRVVGEWWLAADRNTTPERDVRARVRDERRDERERDERARAAAATATCKACGEDKPESEFSPRALRKRATAKCKECGERSRKEGRARGAAATHERARER